jgi:hypothetical protein
MNLKKAIGGALLAGTVAVTGLAGGTAATAFAAAATPVTSATTSSMQPVSNVLSGRTPAPQGFWKYYIVYGPDGRPYRVRKWIP